MNKTIFAMKRFLPRSLVTQVGLYRVFNRLFGQTRQDDGVCIDGQGKPLPWITYPITEFLNQIDFSEATVFEFGAGSSTLWWAERAKAVFSVEREADWFNRLAPALPSNASVTLEENEIEYPRQIHRPGVRFDIVVVDGAVRYPCAQEAISRLEDGGLIILDNTEWYPNTAAMLRKTGFAQIDFCGFCPVNAYPSCTSIFFKTDKWFSRRKNAARWAPIGGRWLQAHDDCPLSEIDPASLRL